MPDPLILKGVYNALPIQLKADQVTNLTLRTSGAIELVNLDRKGRFWARFDGQNAQPLQPGNFVVFMSRRYTTNRGTCDVSLYAEQNTWITVEGSIFG